MSDSVPIRKLPSGVPGLDEVLGGGIPGVLVQSDRRRPGVRQDDARSSDHVREREPRSERPCTSASSASRPSRCFATSNSTRSSTPTKIGDGSVRFVHLGQEALDGGMAKVLEAIVQEVERSNPAIVVVDSFRAMVRSTLAGPAGEMELTDFMQRLALALTSYEATTFLLGEYGDGEHDSAVFTVADGLLWLYQAIDRNSVVRKLQVMKMRGQGQIPGLHTARITDAGYSVFPRILKPEEIVTEHPLKHRLTTGVPGPRRDDGRRHPAGIFGAASPALPARARPCSPISSSSRASKRGENGIVAVFEKRPNDYLQTTPRGEEFQKLIRQKKLEVLYLRPLDLSIDETLMELRDAVKRIGAKRAVIDSLSGLELALAPTFREDFRESLYRMMGALTGLGVTVMATVELADSYVDLRFSPQGIAFLTDAIIIQRYVEIDGELRRAMAVVKVRASQHSKELREYDITSDGGIVVGKTLKGYEGLLTGTPSTDREAAKATNGDGVGLPDLRGRRGPRRRARRRRPDRLLEPLLFRPDRLLPGRGSRPQALGLRPGCRKRSSRSRRSSRRCRTPTHAERLRELLGHQDR